MIGLNKVTVDNIDELLTIEPKKMQKDYILDTKTSLAQAYVQKECKPRCIVKDKKTIGFLMFCVDRDDGEYWLYRFMIGEHFQRKGFGHKALHQLLIELKKDKNRNRLFLGVDEDNQGAIAFYKKWGFQPTGQIYGKEHIFCLKWE